MRVVEAATYRDEIAKKIAHAKHRVVLASLTLLYDTETRPVLDAIAEAQKRGVVVKIVVDVYSRYLPGQEPRLGEWSAVRRRIHETVQFLQDLEHQGATVWLHDGMGWNPFKGRFHQKIVCVDDEVYFAGGVNMTASGIQHVDYMIHTKDATLATMLERQLADAVAAPYVDDSEYEVDTQTRLLIDGGKPGTSLIYERALALTEEAERVTLVSQMCPSGRLAILLKQRDATLYYNHPRQMIFPANMYQWLLQQYYRFDNQYSGEGFLHAKCMLFELPGGKKAVISGSHNFSWRGVAYGTRELAVESYDEELWQSLHDFVQDHVMSST